MGLRVKVVLAAMLAAAATFAAGAGLAQDQTPPSSAGAPAIAPTTPLPEAPRPKKRAAPAASKPAAEPAPLAAPAPHVRLAVGQTMPPGELEAFIDGAAAQAMARDHIAGVAVAVVQNGQLLMKRGYGLDRLRPARAVDPDRTLFRIGGVTQTFTWIALMREIEAGHVRLDAPANLYLPQKDQIPDQGFKRQVMVRDLLDHAAGFEDRIFGQKIEDDPARIRPLDVYLHQERPRRAREPGLTPSFDDYGAALAGEALTQVTGRTMQALVEQEITGPLGMAHTTLREPYPARGDLPGPMDPALAGDVSQGFRWTAGGFRARGFEYMTQEAPAGAASSTARDMARYMLAILGNGTLEDASIYSAALAQDFRTPLQPPAPGAHGWDHGFMEFSLPGGYRGFGHTGATLSFRSKLVTIPELGLGIFIAANTETSQVLIDQLPQRIVERFYAPPPPLAPEPSDWLKDNAPAFAGYYLTTARAYSGLEQFANLLQSRSKVSVTRDGVLLTPGRDGPIRWTPAPGASLDAPYVAFQQADGPDVLVFQMRDGQAVRWFAPSGEASYERSNIFARKWLLAALAAATGLASAAAIAGLFLRDRREFRQTTIQGRADAAQISGSILWLAALGCFVAWDVGTADAANLVYGWPSAWLVIGSSCAFVAAVMTVITLGLLPVVWRGGRRLDSWTIGRKARFTLSTLIFTGFGVMLGLWGALEPWRS